MKLAAYQLSEHLKKNLAPIYLIAGDEELLIQEAKDVVRAAAYKLGFSERQYFETSKDFDWQLLTDAINNLSLFSNKCVIELKLTTKPGLQGGKILVNYAENIPTDKILIITSNKLDQASQKTSWFQSLSQKTVFIPIWPMDYAQLLRWIQQRLQLSGISTNAAGIKIIADFTEGNLLATAQEILKLRLLYPDGTNLSVEQIKEALSDQARYDIFTLLEIALAGNAKKALKILASLKQEGAELPLILWALTKELRLLIQLIEVHKTGINLEATFKKLQIWEKRQGLYKQALQRHDMSSLHRLLIHATQVDGIIKGVYKGNPWDELSQLCLGLSGVFPTLKKSLISRDNC